MASAGMLGTQIGKYVCAPSPLDGTELACGAERSWPEALVRAGGELHYLDFGEIALLGQETANGEDSLRQAGGVDPVDVIGVVGAKDQLVGALWRLLDLIQGPVAPVGGEIGSVEPAVVEDEGE